MIERKFDDFCNHVLNPLELWVFLILQIKVENFVFFSVGTSSLTNSSKDIDVHILKALPQFLTIFQLTLVISIYRLNGLDDGDWQQWVH
jgi:hypothetical protein